MGDLVQGPIGPQGSYDVKVEGGKLVIEAKHTTDLMDSVLKLELKAGLVFGMLIDKIEDMIPGDQKAMAAALKASVLAALG